MLDWSRETAHKLSTQHGLNAEEVEDAIRFVSGLPFTWDDDPDLGRRAIVRVTIRRKLYDVVLFPQLQDPFGETWNLASAYPVNS